MRAPPRRLRCIVLLSLLASVGMLPGCAAWSFAPAPATLEIPAGGADLGSELCRGLIWTEVMIDGRGPYAFIVDSGAQISVIDAAVAREVFPGRIRSTFFLQARGAHGRGVPIEGRVRVSELVVGEFAARELDAIVMDLSGVAARLGRRFDGIVGYPVFRDALLVIDYASGRAAAHRRADRGLLTDDHDEIPLLPGSEPRIELVVAGRTLPFLVDTGAGTRFALAQLDEIAPDGPHPVVSVRRGVDGDLLTRAARLRGTLDLGPLHYERPILHESAHGNRIGGRAFAGARVAFDQWRRVLHVERAGDAPIRMPPHHHLDVFFEMHLDAWVPARTLSGAPPWAVGLRDTDRVIAVDGVPVTDLVCEPLEDFLVGRTEVSLTVLRDGETVEVSLDVIRRFDEETGASSAACGVDASMTGTTKPRLGSGVEAGGSAAAPRRRQRHSRLSESNALHFRPLFIAARCVPVRRPMFRSAARRSS